MSRMTRLGHAARVKNSIHCAVTATAPPQGLVLDSACFGDCPMKRLATVIAAIALIGTPAFAADMAVKAPPPAPAPVYSWTGFYIGASAGYNWSRDDVDPRAGPVAFTSPSFPVTAPNIAAAQIAAIPSALSTNANGFIGGGQLGYNRQLDRYVLGVEADFSGLTGRGSNSSSTFQQIGSSPAGIGIASTTSVDAKLESLGTVRGRIGFTPVDTLLVFATAGFAFGEAKSSTTVTQSCTSAPPLACAVVFPSSATGSASKPLTGWALGGGVEYALTTSWSAKAEYLHYDLGSMTYATTQLASTIGGPFTTINVASTANFKGDIVRVGLNYRF